jgi:hypothetical protein
LFSLASRSIHVDDTLHHNSSQSRFPFRAPDPGKRDSRYGRPARGRLRR